MLENNYQVLIHKNENFIGPGHNAEIVSDWLGHEWILYHAFSKENPHARALMLSRLAWEDDWPVVESNSPLLKAKRPAL